MFRRIYDQSFRGYVTSCLTFAVLGFLFDVEVECWIDDFGRKGEKKRKRKRKAQRKGKIMEERRKTSLVVLPF